MLRELFRVCTHLNQSIAFWAKKATVNEMFGLTLLRFLPSWLYAASVFGVLTYLGKVRRPYLCTFLVLANLFAPPIFAAFVKYLPCFKTQALAEPTMYWSFTPTEQCGSRAQILALWGVLALFFLAFIAFVEYLVRIFSSHESTAAVLNFMTADYTEQAYYYETVVLARKCLMACLATAFPSSYNAGTQIICFLALLAVSARVQAELKPYKTAFLNFVEGSSLGVVSIVSIMAVYVVLDDWSQNANIKITFFCVAYFLACVWMVYLLIYSTSLYLGGHTQVEETKPTPKPVWASEREEEPEEPTEVQEKEEEPEVPFQLEVKKKRRPIEKMQSVRSIVRVTSPRPQRQQLEERLSGASATLAAPAAGSGDSDGISDAGSQAAAEAKP